MCLQKSAGIILLLTALAVLSGCGALDAILPATGTYKINASVNNVPLDDFSIVTSKDKILPFFEEPVSGDPDITELVVFLKDSRNLTTGYKVTYSLIDKDNNNEEGTELQTEQKNSKTENKDEKKNDTGVTETDKTKETNKGDAAVATGSDKNKETNKGDAAVATGSDKNKETNNENTAEKKKDGDAADSDKEDAKDEKTNDKKETPADNSDATEPAEQNKNGNVIKYPVQSLDETLPFFPLPADLPIGKYTLVFQVKAKNTVLYKHERPFFYIADAKISFDGIQVNLPGIAESSQFIQNGTVVLLDINLDFDSRLEPYIVWYNGKKIIDEGSYADGAGSLLWKAPEQNGFVSLRAEVFPSWERAGLTGYQKGISLLVSSKEVDMHLLSKDTPNLVQWYVFEGGLNDSLTRDSEELFIESVERNKPIWLPSNGTYGLASGNENIFLLPDIPFSNNENWEIISRFKPLSEGVIFSVQFGPADVTMTLSSKKSNLILTLASASKTYSESLKLPAGKDLFVTVTIKFFINNGRLSAKLVSVKPASVKPAENFIGQEEPVKNPISVDAAFDKEYKITLGQQQKKPADTTQAAEVKEHTFTALWDELAVLRLSSVEDKTSKKDAKKAPAVETSAEKAPRETTVASAKDNNSILSE